MLRHDRAAVVAPTGHVTELMSLRVDATVFQEPADAGGVAPGPGPRWRFVLCGPRAVAGLPAGVQAERPAEIRHVAAGDGDALVGAGDSMEK